MGLCGSTTKKRKVKKLRKADVIAFCERKTDLGEALLRDKKSLVFKKWKKRYWIIHRGVLRFFERKRSGKLFLKGSIILDGASFHPASKRNKKANKQFCYELFELMEDGKTDKIHLLSLEGNDDRIDEWEHAIFCHKKYEEFIEDLEARQIERDEFDEEYEEEDEYDDDYYDRRFDDYEEEEGTDDEDEEDDLDEYDEEEYEEPKRRPRRIRKR